MSRHLTEAEVLERLTVLTRPRLTAWVEARIVQPVQSGDGPLFREVDFARLQTLCDLAFDLDADEDRLEVMMGLIDRLHALTAEMAWRSIEDHRVTHVPPFTAAFLVLVGEPNPIALHIKADGRHHLTASRPFP